MDADNRRLQQLSFCIAQKEKSYRVPSNLCMFMYPRIVKKSQIPKISFSPKKTCYAATTVVGGAGVLLIALRAGVHTTVRAANDDTAGVLVLVDLHPARAVAESKCSC
jgi:hypothetical protein